MAKFVFLALALLACAAVAARAQSADCDRSQGPKSVAAVKALVDGDSKVNVLWLPPPDGGCISSFKVAAKDTATGRWLDTKTVSDGLSTEYTGLTPGATYEFYVTPQGPAGSASGLSARAAMPPAQLDVKPDAPENLDVVATGEGSVKLSWGLPPGNPKVDQYTIQAVPVNATGYPNGGQNRTFAAKGTAKAVTISSLQPGGYYAFVVRAKNDQGTSDVPAVAFQRMPRSGEVAPGAPSGLSVTQAGPNAAALSWNAPSGGADFYQLSITQVDGSGKALSETNTLPNKNTTAIIRDLNPGSTYRFDVQSFSTAYKTGESASYTYTLPGSYGAPQAMQTAPADLRADVYGNQVRLAWAPFAGASSYVVTAYDAYSGRSLGVQYQTTESAIALDGLPVGTSIEIVVQGKSGDYYTHPASAVVEIPYSAPANYGYGYAYGADYSPYYGYNPYMPYWYSSYYPIGWYNTWYPGKWIINGIANVLNPFNWFWGPNWWYNRPTWWNPLPGWTRPWNNWGWGAVAGGVGGAILANKMRPTTLPGRPNLPGQRPFPTTRPAPISPGVRPTTRPAPLPGGVGGGGAVTRPAPLPTTRPAPGGGGGGLYGPDGRPLAPGASGNSPGRPTTRPAPLPGTGGGGMSGMTRPAPLPGTGGGMSGMARPSLPTGGMPMTRPAPMPATRPGGWGGGSGGFARPAPMPSRPGGFGGGGGGFARPAPMPMARPAIGGGGGGGMLRGGR